MRSLTHCLLLGLRGCTLILKQFKEVILIDSYEAYGFLLLNVHRRPLNFMILISMRDGRLFMARDRFEILGLCALVVHVWGPERILWEHTVTVIGLLP